jgi:hypothetical protein
MRVSSESNHDTEPACSLTRRSSLSRPLDGYIRTYMMVASGIGECGEALQACAFGLESESTRPTHRDV